MKNLILSSIIILNSYIVIGQRFVYPESNWYYTADMLDGSKGSIHMSYEKDTTIKNKKYQMITGFLILTNKSTCYNLDKIYLRQSNDTIYCFDKQGNDRFCWNQNPKKGDVWYYGEYCDNKVTKKIYTRVDSVEDVYINGISYKNIYSTPNVDSDGKDLNETTYYYPIFVRKISTMYGPSSYFTNISNLEFTEYIDGNLTNHIICFSSRYCSLYRPNQKNCLNLDK